MHRFSHFSGIALLLLMSASGVQAQERYFLMVFGAQRTPPDPRYAHSFAIFAREVCLPTGKKLDPLSISWLASSGVVRVNALLPEEGRNWGIHETLAWCYQNDMRVSLWGPYQIEPGLFERAVTQHNLLQSGQVKYKAVDSGFPTNRVSNCIHAIASVADGYRLRVASPGWGETASYAITMRFEPYFINPEQRHPWLVLALDLGKYPIIYRELEVPRSGVVWSLLRTTTHHEEKRPPTQVLGQAPVVPGPVPPP